MITVWWVRHAPTHQKTMTGWRDVPGDFSDTQAIGRLDAFLPANTPLVASDLQRASHTADAISANRMRLPDMTDLREFNFGDWDGKPFTEIAENDPDLSRAFWERPGDIAPPRGESWNDVSRRVEACVGQLCQASDASDIVIVAHIGVILTQVALCRDFNPLRALSHRIDNLSVSKIARGPDMESLLINHVP